METAVGYVSHLQFSLWFAFILVSLNHWKQLSSSAQYGIGVVICFHFSIFEPLETATVWKMYYQKLLWFAFILVSLNHWKQPGNNKITVVPVVICFHFSIFEPLETAAWLRKDYPHMLWFAFILVSLNHWKQLSWKGRRSRLVVICFHFSIFEPLETADTRMVYHPTELWFAFILVSLNHWKQLKKR